MRNGRRGLTGTLSLAALAASALFAGAAAFAQERGLAVRRAEASAPTGEYWLLVIGIDEYARLPRLNTAVADARAITKVLQERYGFTGNRTTSLFNTDATASNILGALRDQAKQLTPNDSLLIYYAGHGHVDEITQTGSWLPVGADPKDPSTWIDNSKIKAYVRAMKARHVFLISDSCFSGDFFRSSRAALPEITDAYVRKAFAKTSREAITSGGIEPVSDAGFANHSVFAHFLLKTLRESTEAYLLPAAIHERVKGGVAINARQQTQHGVLAGTGGEVGGSFVLFLADTGGIANLDRALAEKKRRMSLLERREAEAKAASRAQAAEVAKREKAIAVMDAKIAAMKRKLGAAGGAGDSTLDDMLALVREKEEQQKELEEMRRRAERERRAREAEIARLRQAALDADLAKYTEIVSSEFGKGMRQQAWDAVLTKWGLRAGSVLAGDWVTLGEKLGLIPTLTLDLGGGVTMEFVLIPAGEFTMGSPDSEANRGSDEGPQHRVRITKAFYMDKYEVTQEQYERIMGKAPSNFKGSDLPVERVSWNDATKFCRTLSQRTGKQVRLPTEAEWEYACRAGSRFCFGDSDSGLGDYAWYSSNSGWKTHPVGGKGANAWGLHDIHGNVWEWCSDWYDKDYYANSPVANPAGSASGRYRVLRGGSWSCHGGDCRSAHRDRFGPTFRSSHFGFRVVVSPSPGS